MSSLRREWWMEGQFPQTVPGPKYMPWLKDGAWPIGVSRPKALAWIKARAYTKDVSGNKTELDLICWVNQALYFKVIKNAYCKKFWKCILLNIFLLLIGIF